jgi:hypothetical protein
MRSILIALALAATALPAVAGTPMPGNSTLPARIYIVGSNGVTADAPFGQFQVTVRDLANNPVGGSTVMVDFSPITELRIASNQLDAATVTNCPHRFVKRITDDSGTAALTVMGRANGLSPQAGVLHANVYADGVLIGQVPVSIYDLDGTNGLGANDISLWLGDFAAPQFYGRGDYDGDGRLGANDLSLWIGAMGAGGSSFSAATVCP